MPETDQSSDLKIETPGDGPAADPALAPAPALDTTGETPDVIALKTENAQLRATVELLNQQIMDLQDGGASPATPAAPREARIIGENWSMMTAAEARAKGCTHTVLCSDGYFVP